MKTALIDLLEFPRQLVRGGMELDDCPHNGFYDSLDFKCIECPQGDECEWLHSNDEFAALHSRDIEHLVRALDFALCYVRAGISEWEHNPEQCACSVCSWYREAQEAYDKAAT